MITGTLKPIAKTPNFTLSIGTLLFDVAGLRVMPNEYNHPDYYIEARTH